MVTISKVGDSTIKFEFTNNDHYLYNNGEISVPLNSLILVTDDTDLVVFKKIDGDVFVTFLIGNSNFSSKDELVAWYKENMVDGGGSDITSGDVQSMIDESISGKADSSAVTEEISAAVSGKQDTLIAGENITISGNVISAAGGNNAIELTQAEYDALVSGGTVDPTAFYIITDATPIDLSNYYTSAQTNNAINAAVSGKVDTSAITSSVTSASTDSEIPTAKAVYDAVGSGGGGKAVSGGTNISITTGETADTINCTLPITASTSITSSDDIAFGTDIGDNTRGYNVKIGRKIQFTGVSKYNIAISRYDTSSNSYSKIKNGEKNVGIGRFEIDGNNAVAIGNSLTVKTQGIGIGNSCIAEASATAIGIAANAKGSYSTALSQCLTNNESEFAAGKYNASNTGSTDADNTLFSIGNGTANYARHNAFEIRKNGDIYFFDGTNDVKLQDKFSSLDTTIGNINTILESI